jgi:hypothetical protein
MKRALIALIAGTVLSGLVTAYVATAASAEAKGKVAASR